MVQWKFWHCSHPWPTHYLCTWYHSSIIYDGTGNWSAMCSYLGGTSRRAVCMPSSDHYQKRPSPLPGPRSNTSWPCLPLRACQIALVHTLASRCATVSFSYPKRIMCWYWNRITNKIWICLVWNFINKFGTSCMLCWFVWFICVLVSLALVRIEGRSRYETIDPLQLPPCFPSFLYRGKESVRKEEASSSSEPTGAESAGGSHKGGWEWGRDSVSQ